MKIAMATRPANCHSVLAALAATIPQPMANKTSNNPPMCQHFLQALLLPFRVVYNRRHPQPGSFRVLTLGVGSNYFHQKIIGMLLLAGFY